MIRGDQQALAAGCFHRMVVEERSGDDEGWIEGARSWCQANIVEGIWRWRRTRLRSLHNRRQIPLRIPQDPPLVDERRGHAYISNSIRSSRYTVYDFLPKQLFFQWTRLSNFYFLCIAIPQTIPGISTTGNYTTILPLIFFVAFEMAKEGYDDYRKHKLDKVENNRKTTVLKHGTGRTEGAALDEKRLWNWSSKKPPVLETVEKARTAGNPLQWTVTRWCDIKVGDVVRLGRDESFPADLVVLHADGENGLAYIETTALDGETNLKGRQALPDLRICETIEGIQSCQADFLIEDPNRDLYEFNGRVTTDEKTLPLTLNEVIYRGSTLRNTGLVIGLVVNTGEECKIRMNANHHPTAKKPQLEKFANQIVLFLICYVILLSIGCTMGYYMWQRSTERHSWYLSDASVNYKNIFIGFLIAFNNNIPLAMYVTLELVKIGQQLMLDGDVELYDEPSNTPMRCNTNTILENLGQIGHVLTDKTGTLTENIMKFRKMSVAGTAWIHHYSDEEPARHRSATFDSLKLENDDSSSESFRAVNTAHSKTPASPLVKHEKSPSVSMSPESPTEATAQHTEQPTTELLQHMQREPVSPVSHKARDFILAMAICHTCLPETWDGTIDFQGSSTDEVALVRAARDLGYLLMHRTSQSITLIHRNTNGHEVEETYEILDVIEFSSKRKRMSIIVRCPDGRIWLICKGADDMILPRLTQASLLLPEIQKERKSREIQRKSLQRDRRRSMGPSTEIYNRPSFSSRDDFPVDDNFSTPGRCMEHVDNFAADGLRTLLFAHKIIPGPDYTRWKEQFQEANTSVVNRQERIEAISELIEESFDLLGATAIEDKLQQGVPETIEKLRRAHMRIWMLTGDKRETAIKIAHSAGICRPGSDIFNLVGFKADNLGSQISTVLEELSTAADQSCDAVVVLDGHTLAVIEKDADLKDPFYSLADSVSSVICCRASPAQKAAIVETIKSRIPGSLTLAIGDGANDISMIQTAHVGIGISGKEGLQASRVADYSIAQFRFLQRLLLVHGRWNYVRTAKFVLLTFWKESFFYIMQALYQLYNGYTGTSLYEMWSLTALNTLFTSLCVIVMGVFEQDISAEILLAVPELYVYGQSNAGLNLRKYLTWMVGAVSSGMIVWFTCWTAYAIFGLAIDQGLFAFGDLVFTLAVIWTNCKLLIFETHHKTIIAIASFFITFAGWWAWNLFLSAVYASQPSPYAARDGFTHIFGRDPTWWLTVGLVLGILVILELAYKSLHRTAKRSGWLKRFRFRRGRRPRLAEFLDVSLWQELEQDPTAREMIAKGLIFSE